MSELSGRIRIVALAATHALLLFAGLAAAADSAPTTDPPSCRAVRISDIGWTDVTTTTAVFGALLRHLGYQPEIIVLSVPVTFASMKNKDIDVFLGNWMPAEEGDRKSFVEEGSVEVIRANLIGAKYTLAVPAYVYAAGLRSFADIQRFTAQLNNAPTRQLAGLLEKL